MFPSTNGGALCDSSDPLDRPSRPDLSQREIDALSDRIAELSAHITAATYRLLVLIREYDVSEGWHRAGFNSCARWLSWRIGIGAGAARERVRVARALEELPQLSSALERGELSYSVARALTRVATPETEAELVEVAKCSTAAQMEKLVSAWRATDRAAEARRSRTREREQGRHRSRGLTVVEDAADGSYVVRGRLDPEAGAALSRALEAAADELYAGEGHPGDEEDADRPVAARRADALGLVAEAALGQGLSEPARTADRCRVVVHVSAETLAGAGAGEKGVSAETSEADTGEDPPRLEGGPHLVAETARRPGCDASVVGMIRDGEGSVLDRWRLEGDPGGRLRFIRPDGRELSEVPARPPAPEDPAPTLLKEQQGLGIDAWTATPDWDGTPMEVDWAISVLHPRAREVEPDRDNPVSAETSGDRVSAETPDGG